MKELFSKLWLLVFPCVGKRKAIQIARRALVTDTSRFRVYGSKPAGVSVYNLPTEPCWYIFAPLNDGYDGTMLRSSYLLIISKRTGKVLYKGSAGDEG